MHPSRRARPVSALGDLRILSTKPPVWIEAVAVTKGKGPDAIPPTAFGAVYDVPQDQMLLRLTQALENKAGKYKRYLAEGVVAAEDPFVIAVNRGLLGYLDPEVPLI